MRVLHLLPLFLLGCATTAPQTVSTDALPQAPNRTMVVTGGITKATVRQVVHAHLDDITGCYKRGLVDDRELSGDVRVRFVIVADGAVAESAVENSTLLSPTVEQCVVDSVRRWSFPALETGNRATVSYPFVLKSALDSPPKELP